MSRRLQNRRREEKRSGWGVIVLWLAVAGGAAQAQPSLSLPEALRIAREQNPGLRAAEAAAAAARGRIRQAQSGLLPTIHYAESIQWGTNPVYVFGSLLAQHRFTAENFDLKRLNRPEPLTNFASQLVAEQVLFDGRQAEQRVKAAEAATQMAEEARRERELELLAEVAEAYFGVGLAEEERRLAEEMLETAGADLERAAAQQQAGVVTEVEVLTARAHRAALEERLIQAESGRQVAQARLSQALGLPLDTQFRLSTSLRMVDPVRESLEELEARAMREHPRARQAELAFLVAEAQQGEARGAFLPQVAAQGSFEVNRRSFLSGGGSNWMAGVTLRWNLFRGFADRAELQQAAALREQREQERREMVTAVRFQVRKAYWDLQAANRRIDAAEAAVAQAEEAQRVLANRYEAGVAGLNEVLHSETALTDAKTRLLRAFHDQRVASARLQLAVGTLSVDSPAVLP